MFFSRSLFQSTLRSAALLCALAGTSIGITLNVQAAESAVVIPAPLTDNSKAAGPEQTAVLAGGCFWGVQGVFEHVRGVRQVLSGYAGGNSATANYETVSSGRSGHAESVQIRFDPEQISFGTILQIYFSVAHNPTQLNRQGPDTGSQYRSVIFYTNETQKNIATAYIAQLDKAKKFDDAIVTRVDPLKAFYPAEDYHQDFLIKNPRHPYIVYNDLPKIRNLKQVFPELYQGTPATVSNSQ